MNFFKKFFGYVTNEDGVVEPYSDGLGRGTFTDWRHYIWILLVIGICVLLYQLFKRHQKAGRITVFVLCTLLFVTRVVNQAVRAGIGAESPAWRALPFHMCTVLTFVMPIVAIFQIDKMKTATYVLSIMGGIITIMVNDYFDNAFMTFATLEGITAHSILIIIPICEIALGRFKLNIKNSWQVIVGILILIGWAELANYVFFAEYDTNYMYLRHNALPGNIGGDLFFLVYVAIFAVFFGVIYGSPMLYRLIKFKIEERKTKKPVE